MKAIALIIVLCSMANQAISSTTDKRWDELSEKYRNEISLGAQKKESVMTERQKYMAHALVQGLPKCALYASRYNNWEGESVSRIIFEREIKRCVIQEFSRQLDREDWKMAEEMNTVVKKISPRFAMPGVDDRG